MHEKNHGSGEAALVSRRTVDVAVALLLLGVCAVVIYDASRIGFGWIEGQGPAPGYFPFYVAVIMGFASVVNLARALLDVGGGGDQAFVSRRAFGRVLSVLAPTLAYICLIGGVELGPVSIPRLGFYVASGLFIAGFIASFGLVRPVRVGAAVNHVMKAVAVGIAVPLALFMMFERWFLVPLPKGPLEAWLGF